MVALSIHYDYEKAAGLVARGNELEAAAAKAKIPFEDLKEYTIEYAEVWHRIIKNERQQLLGQAGAEAPPCDVPAIVEAETETVVEAPSVPEKPVRPDEIEIFPTLNPNRRGLLAYERYERRPLSHDRGGGQPWERSETFCLNDERSPRK